MFSITLFIFITTISLSTTTLPSALSVQQTFSSCTTDLDCPLDQFCHQQKCICLDSHIPNPNPTLNGPKCIPQHLIEPYSNVSCSTDEQCVHFAECNHQKGKCQCKGEGWSINKINWECDQPCSNDADCNAYHNLECTKKSWDKQKSCHCALGFARHLNNCFREMSPIGEPCETDPLAPRILGCHESAVCKKIDSDGQKAKTCACPVESVPAKDGYSCMYNNCTSNADCEAHHKNTYCILNNGISRGCDCIDRFRYKKESCILEEGISRLGETCSGNEGCGTKAKCLKRKCQCKDGNKAEKNGVNCTPVSCAKDDDCRLENVNWYCNTTTLLCYKPINASTESETAPLLLIFVCFFIFIKFN